MAWRQPLGPWRRQTVRQNRSARTFTVQRRETHLSERLLAALYDEQGRGHTCQGEGVGEELRQNALRAPSPEPRA